MRNTNRHVGLDARTVKCKNTVDPALHGVVRSMSKLMKRAGRWSEMSSLSNLVFSLWYFEVVPFIDSVGKVFIVAKPRQQ